MTKVHVTGVLRLGHPAETWAKGNARVLVDVRAHAWFGSAGRRRGFDSPSGRRKR